MYWGTQVDRYGLSRFFFITRILNQIGVSYHSGGRDGEHVAEGREVASAQDAALPAPQVISRSAKAVETNQIHATTSLEIELTAPLVHNLIEGVRRTLFCVSTGTDSVKGIDGLGRGNSSGLAGQRLGIGQIGLGRTHQEEIRIGKRWVTGDAAVGLEIVELGDSITVKEITGICILQSAATTGVEQRTVVPAQFCHHITWLPIRSIVIGEKLANQLRTGTVTSPLSVGSQTVNFRIIIRILVHIPIKSRCYQECGSAPSVNTIVHENLGTITGKRKNGLGSSCGIAIVTHKQHLVWRVLTINTVNAVAGITLRVQFVRTVDDHLGIAGGIGPARHTSIYLCIQVKSCQQQVGSVTVNAAIIHFTLVAGHRVTQSLAQAE